jgi:predicted TIM-barrel fold metal-dependent hydrolase
MIDFHTYPFTIKEYVGEGSVLQQQIRDVFGLVSGLQPLETFLLRMDIANIEKAVLLPIDCSTARGCCLFTNEQIAQICRENDRFIGFASVDPHSKGARDQLKKAVEKLGLKGLKLSPGLQEFYPNDTKLYPLYETAASLDIPVMIHTGINWGKGARIKHSLPLLVEDVACDFPNLKIVLTRLGWPWVLDTVALLVKYPNVYCDTAGHVFAGGGEFLAFELSQQIPLAAVENSLRYKLVFGSDYPRVWIKTMVDAVKALDLSEDCLDLIFRRNAEKLLGVM